MSVLVENRKARHDYHVLERIETGIALSGTEVKSCRAHGISLAEAYARPDGNSLWLVGAHIAPYEQGNRNNHPPRRDRRLLLHRREIRHLRQAVEAKGLTLIPLRVYINPRGLIKVELGLCRGRSTHDRRDTLREQEDRREAQRVIRGRA
ncbi:MAG: SsrA-binding protein SmpB [Lentisphaeria bacterium]|nr:SsrA-binding protein SmpB [Lentisphaeria bacterium]